MTKRQRDRIVNLLVDGATLREAAAIAQVPWPTFEKEWRKARKEREEGKDSAASRWYSLAQAERAAFRATLRRTAVQQAGKKASTDNLALLKHLDSEEEPTAEADEVNSAIRIYVETTDPKVQALAKAAYQSHTALLEALAGSR
jgi:hypothetical protein